MTKLTTKTDNIQLCALDEGAFKLKILCQRNVLI